MKIFFLAVHVWGLAWALFAQSPVSPLFTVTNADLKAMVADLPSEVQEKILAAPSAFLGDYKPLLSEPWDLLVLVDKRTELPQDYEPKDLVPLKSYPLSTSRADLRLRKAYIDKFVALDKAARKEGLKLVFSSSYRSWIYQKDLFQRYVNQDGVATADKYSARAGHSQHQLGTVVDFGSVTPEFAQTKEGQWLAANGWKFGFSMSYPEGKASVTGYEYEPWHFRYIGIPAAKVQKTWFADLQQDLLTFHAKNAAALKAAVKRSN